MATHIQWSKNLPLVAISSGSKKVIGKAVRIENDGIGAFGAFCKVLRPNDEVDPLLFSFYFKRPEYRFHISNAVSGANINNIRNEHLDDLNFPIIDNPSNVADILDKTDALRKKRKESIKLLDDFLRSTFLAMFGDPHKNPKGWDKKTIRQLTVKIEKINPQKRPNLNYIDISSIDNDKKIISSTKEFQGFNAPSRARQLLKQNDILISTVRPNLNAVAVVIDELENLVGSTGFCVLRTDNNINHRYMFEIVKSNYFVNSLVKKVIGANYPAVSNSHVLEVEIPVPPEELQNKFAKIVQQVEKLKAKYKESEKELDNLFGSLMQRAFKGEL